MRPGGWESREEGQQYGALGNRNQQLLASSGPGHDKGSLLSGHSWSHRALQGVGVGWGGVAMSTMIPVAISPQVRRGRAGECERCSGLALLLDRAG